MKPDDGPIAALTRSLDYPLLVATVSDGRDRAGCLVGFWTQCSIDPVRIAVGLSRANHTFRVACGASDLVAHVLRATDVDLATRFGGETADDAIDKFAGLRPEPGPGGAPVLPRCDWMGGPILERVDAGDHVLHVVEIVAAAARRAHEPQLGFAAVRDLDPGHAP